MIHDTITPKVAIYVVTKALSHHGLKAINKVNPHTTKAEHRNSQKKPDSLIEYYLWMLSEKSNSSKEIHIEYGQKLKTK